MTPQRPVSRSWQGQIQSRGKVGMSSEHEDDQVDVSSPDKVNHQMPGRHDNVGRCVLEPPE